MNSGLLTQREKKIQFIKGHMKRSDTIAAILALICLVLSYYEVIFMFIIHNNIIIYYMENFERMMIFIMLLKILILELSVNLQMKALLGAMRLEELLY